MKVINVSELKANLSRYLRMASRGARIVVQDRDDPVAEIGPPAPSAGDWRDRLERAGRLRRGSQRWESLRFSKLKDTIDVAAALRATREDPGEVRRR